MKYFFLSLFLFICLNKNTYGQRLITAESFAINTPFLEPEERILSERVGKEGIISLAKNKGSSKGPSFYQLEFRRPDLSLKWSTSIRIADQENVLHLKVKDQQVIVYTVAHNEKQKSTSLQAAVYNIYDGEPVSEKILLKNEVNPWFSADQKGAVKRDFISLILSGSKKGYVTPLEYRYYMDYSPDGSLLLFYRYDFSKPNLLVEAYIFDEKHQIIKNAILPIDNGYINHGLHLSPKGNIYILNTRIDGAVAVVYFDLDEKASRFLEISSSNTRRAHFKLFVESEHNAVVSYLNYRENSLYGLSYARFNFKDEKIDWVNYHELHHRLDSLSTASKQMPRKNYELINRASFKDGHLFFLEQREFLSPGKQFSIENGDHINFWKPGKSQLTLGNVLILYINSKDSLEWVKIIPKNQSASSEEGLLSIGFEWEVFEDEVKLLYAEGVGSVSKLTHIVVDYKGKILEKELPNEQNIVFLRPYTHWFGELTLIIAGKKGQSGKSSVLLKYKVQ